MLDEKWGRKIRHFFQPPLGHFFFATETLAFSVAEEVLLILAVFFSFFSWQPAATPRASRVGRADWRPRFGAARARASGSKPAKPRHLASCVERSDAARLMS